MIVRKEIDLTQPLTPSQVEMLHNLESKPISPDEDCPELTMDQLAQFQRISAANRDSDGLLCQRQPIGSILISFVP